MRIIVRDCCKNEGMGGVAFFFDYDQIFCL